jgi:hypothetical protein
MPQDFINCVNSGGKVITETLKGNKYRRVCFDKKGRHEGEIKTKKKKKKSKANKKLENSKALAADLRKLQKHFNDKRNQ